MFEPQPGPLARMDADEVQPFPMRQSFTGIVADGLSDAPGVSDTIASASLHVGEGSGDSVEQAFATDMAGVPGSLNTAIDGVASSPAAQLDANGQPVDGLRDRVLPYLPDVNTDVQLSLVAPPAQPSVGGPPPQRGPFTPDE